MSANPHDPPVQTVSEAKAKLIAYLNPWIVLDTRPEVDEPHGFDLIDALSVAARAEGRAEAQQEIERLRQADIPITVVACCEHCDLPMVCPAAQAERIHGLEVMHAETLTRAEAAEAEVTRLKTRQAQCEQEPMCVCQVDDGLVQEWVSKARAVAISKGFQPLPRPVGTEPRPVCKNTKACSEPCEDDDGVSYCTQCGLWEGAR